MQHLFQKEKMDQYAIPFLFSFIIVELVLGGAGRVLTIGPSISIRYLLFGLAMLYFVYQFFKQGVNWGDRFYRDLLIFFAFFAYSLLNGYLSGFTLSNIVQAAKGYLFLFMYFPFSIYVNSEERARKLLKLFVNSSVILGIITIVVFVIYFLDDENYYVITPILEQLNYGYIALRGGLPAVFFKTSPFLAVSLITVLLAFINIKEERSITNVLKLAILGFSTMATMSMGVWIATFVGVILAILLSKGTSRMVGLRIIVGFSAVMFFLFSDYILEALRNRLSTTDSSYIIKQDQLYQLLDVWSDKPIFGNGFGIELTFVSALETRTMVNFELFWIQLLVNMGLLGFVTYVTIFIRCAVYGYQVWRGKVSLEQEMHLKALVVGLIMMSIVSSVNPYMNNPIGIGYLVLVMASVQQYHAQKEGIS